jgi:hypothetical protein
VAIRLLFARDAFRRSDAGRVPAGQVRYDNLSAAVWRVLRRGRATAENPRAKEVS